MSPTVTAPVATTAAAPTAPQDAAALPLVSRLALGVDQHQRLRTSQALLALAVYLVFAGVQHLEVLMGFIDAADSWRLTAWNLGGGLLFYALVRSGLNLQLAARLQGDAALTVPQSLWAMVGIAWSYGITGPARGAVILIMMLIMVFGIFSLRPRQSRTLALAGFVMLGAVMVWKAITDPAQYDPRIEGLHLAFAGIVMATIAALAVRMGRLRSRLRQQRGELVLALERIQALATRDELTGLTNRRAALDRMRSELAVRERAEPLMSVALIDLDHFKRFNDRHGHAAGDAVLRRFAEVAQHEVRAGDVLARWGGEEFLLVLPATAADAACAGVQRLRARLHAQRFDDLVPGETTLTFSAGVAECAGAADLEAAIERADRAMYRAKNGGRDRTVCAGAR